MSSEVAMLRAELAELTETVAAMRAEVQQSVQLTGTLADLVRALRDQKPVVMPQPIVNVDIPPAPPPEVRVEVQQAAAAAPMMAVSPIGAEIDHQWEGSRIVKSIVTWNHGRSH